MSTFILAITGPTGSGKTTTASKLAEQIEQCVNIDVDGVKHMVVSGFVYGNGPEGIPQWQLLGTNIGMLAKNFQEAGYNVIVNGFLKEPAWKNIQEQVAIDHKVLLLPHIDTIMERDAKRHKDIQMGTEAVTEHHDYFSNASFYDDFVKLDSTTHNVNETVQQILEVIQGEVQR